MQKDMKFKILTEASEHGISKTCEKYGISRTIYYRWLKRYQSLGLAGLEDAKRSFTPENKTAPEVENAVLSLIKTYPSYGPRAIKYLLEEINYYISESAVFNIMKRNNLTNKEKRLRFSKKRVTAEPSISLPIEDLKTGECWLFWIIDCGHFPDHGKVYAYTIMDAKSRVVCSRLYKKIAYIHFEDLLTEVALPIAQSLNMNPKYLSFFYDSNILATSPKLFLPALHNALHDRGFEMDVHIITVDHTMHDFLNLRTEYTKGCLESILPLLQEHTPFLEIKTEMQRFMRYFNLEQKFLLDGKMQSPVEYHTTLTNSKTILPIWAYMDRPY